MALTNQPYLPLYIQDWLTNTKLKQCLLGGHGLMINIMCLMHKEETYGKVLLRQKFKQTDKPEKNFAIMLAKLLPFDLHDIEINLAELIEEKVLIIKDDYLICKRMVKDAETSAARAANGKKGGDKNKEKNFISTDNFAYANREANSEYEYEINNNSKSVFNTMPVSENFNGLPEIKIGSVIELFKITKQTDISSDQVSGLWNVFKIQNLTGKKYYANEDEVYSHFINWSKKQNIETNGKSKTSTVGKDFKFDKP